MGLVEWTLYHFNIVLWVGVVLCLVFFFRVFNKGWCFPKKINYYLCISGIDMFFFLS